MAQTAIENGKNSRSRGKSRARPGKTPACFAEKLKFRAVLSSQAIRRFFGWRAIQHI
jgi:hypothetical protein